MLEAYINQFSFYNTDLLELYINVDKSKNIFIEIIDKICIG